MALQLPLSGEPVQSIDRVGGSGDNGNLIYASPISI